MLGLYADEEYLFDGAFDVLETKRTEENCDAGCPFIAMLNGLQKKFMVIVVSFVPYRLPLPFVVTLSIQHSKRASF